jgi:non-ribosomal peptide synthase protein (TIGR01720 family)
MVIFGGEALNPGRLQEWQAAYPATQLINMYGITETTVHVTYKEITPGDIESAISNVGKPIPTLTVYLLDRYLKLVPPGAAGELCVGGDGVARGYLNRPELSAEKFITRTYLNKKDLPGVHGGQNKGFLEKSPPGRQDQTIYRSGDLARWLDKGELEYLGRIDQQVKIRGFRIESGEIEHCLAAHDQIKEVAVLARETAPGEKYLCAYYVSDETIRVSGLREHLAGRLPNYMIPAHFVRVEKIPLTLNGKLDRQALPEPVFNLDTENHEAPVNTIQEKLAETWQEILGLKKIGINNNFFEIGGDSIKAIRISARLQKAGLKMEIRDLFLNPTIIQLSRYIKKTDRLIPQEPVEGEVHLTPIQCWFFEKFLDGAHHYNQAVMLFKPGGFAEHIVAEVFSRLVRHHDALRMIYRFNRDSAGRITVLQRNRSLEAEKEETFFHLEILDLKTPEKEEIERQITAAANRLQAGIDLEKGPLVKLGLFKTPEGDHLLIVIHHLVIDGVSWRILLEDFTAGYRQAEQGREFHLQDKTDAYQYWAQTLREYADSAKILEELPYWQRIENEKIAPLPRDTEISTTPEKKAYEFRETVGMNLDPRDTETLLTEVNHAYGTEINDILLTALAMAVRQWCGMDKILVNLEGHGRESIVAGINPARTLGWFTSQFPVILEIDSSDDLTHSIKTVKEMIRQIPHKGIGYGILRYLTPTGKKPGISLAREPEISFNYLGQFGQEVNEDNDSMEPSPLFHGLTLNPRLQPPYAIEINGIIAKKGELLLGFTYNIHEYKKSTIEQLAGLYRESLLSIIRHCSRKQEQELTPSDLTYSGFSIDQLDELSSKIKNLVEIEN